jgi:RNA polymerase sigma factor (TIGR02999 family)
VENELSEITLLLNEAARGDGEAARKVFPAIYRELRKLASARASRLPPGATLQTTALVHETYLRVAGRNPEGWESARHFYFVAARAMRDILVEDARRKKAPKYGGDKNRVEFHDDIPWLYETSPDEVLALDDALAKLEREDAEGHRLVMLHFYTGLTFVEIAEMDGVSSRTIERKWRFLRVWLARELGEA